ncbi:MAG: DUF1365 domain-containing protein [Alphaproteobacteria bacterium]
MNSAATSLPDAAIYFGHVMHCRLRPFRHRFAYRVFSLFMDIDALDALATRSVFFSHNRFNFFSIMDKDHGPADGSPLRPWAEGLLDGIGIGITGGRIFMLCFPRMFGYVFNPLTVFFCFDPQSRLRGLIYEVRNTFGEKHPYVIALNDIPAPDALITHRHAKLFYVSPFIGMNMNYTFRLRLPGEKLSVMIREYAPEGELLIATLTGERRQFCTATLIRVLFLYPLMSLKIIAAIHFEALRLWRKGAKFVSRTPASAT